MISPWSPNESQRTLLYAESLRLTKATKSLAKAKLLVPKRTTFYGANEAWFELADGQILGISERA